jgi:hypothetical protein
MLVLLSMSRPMVAGASAAENNVSVAPLTIFDHRVDDHQIGVRAEDGLILCCRRERRQERDDEARSQHAQQ